MEVRKGYVEHIVFRNNDNGYTVFQLVSEEEELTCVGLFSVLAEVILWSVFRPDWKESPMRGFPADVLKRWRVWMMRS